MDGKNCNVYGKQSLPCINPTDKQWPGYWKSIVTVSMIQFNVFEDDFWNLFEFQIPWIQRRNFNSLNFKKGS